MQDSNGNLLVHGAMYCFITLVDDYEGNVYENFGDLVRYGSDGEFYDADTSEHINPDYDYLIKQGDHVDQRYIFSGDLK